MLIKTLPLFYTGFILSFQIRLVYIHKPFYNLSPLQSKKIQLVFGGRLKAILLFQEIGQYKNGTFLHPQ